MSERGEIENRDRKRPEAAMDGPFLTFSVEDIEPASRSPWGF
jgi:hypothetical protein